SEGTALLLVNLRSKPPAKQLYRKVWKIISRHITKPFTIANTKINQKACVTTTCCVPADVRPPDEPPLLLPPLPLPAPVSTFVGRAPGVLVDIVRVYVSPDPPHSSTPHHAYLVLAPKNEEVVVQQDSVEVLSSDADIFGAAAGVGGGLEVTGGTPPAFV